MDKFLAHDSSLAVRINGCAQDLYARLKNIRAGELGLPEHCLHYYKASHSGRLFFSIETSAHLLFRSITLTGMEPEQVTLMDYGAGVGTLYLLAKLTGCRQVIYNDHLDDWRLSAQLIAQAAGITIDRYIVGDIDTCLGELEREKIRCHIIASRNVIEHIYDLGRFYDAVHRKQPLAIIYSSTTANSRNPASVIKHNLWHHKWEKVYRGKRLVVIDRQAPRLSPGKRMQLAKATRGLAGGELEKAIETYRQTGRMPNARIHGSNTCDPSSGVWAEHMLSESAYRKMINEEHYEIGFAPGFWDTHYTKAVMNRIGKFLNRLIRRSKRIQMHVAPFIYVIAKPRQQQASPINKS